MILNTSIDNSYLYVHLSSISDPKGIVHICHGKAEHIGRYEWLISNLNDDGYHVISIDHRGHGKRIESNDDIGKFSDNQNGWEMVVNDFEISEDDLISYYSENPNLFLVPEKRSFYEINLSSKNFDFDISEEEFAAGYDAYLSSLKRQENSRREIDEMKKDIDELKSLLKEFLNGSR